MDEILRGFHPFYVNCFLLLVLCEQAILLITVQVVEMYKAGERYSFEISICCKSHSYFLPVLYYIFMTNTNYLTYIPRRGCLRLGD